jgi:histidyl-tRNA synthetase
MNRLPGFRDFYPEPLPQAEAWSTELRQHIFATWRAQATRYGFKEYDGPPLEPTELYTAKSGDEIVNQLYHFQDRGNRAVALRPEMTPTLARMVAAHERNYRKPIKWFAIPQLFRAERQQKGRLREHFQFNADLFGETDPAADAELIALLIDSLRAFGLTADDLVVRLSSRNAWQEFFTRGTNDPSQAYAFYQIIDKLEREAPEVSDSKLRPLGFSLDQVHSFIQAATPTQELEAIVSNLAARGLGAFVKIDYTVIRGLAYYTGPVFEAFDRKGELRAIAGGGRYDQLVSQLSNGKVNLPGLGFGMGDVVLGELLRQRDLVPQGRGAIDVYCVLSEESLRATMLALVQRLREQGYSTDYPLTAVKPDKQVKRALELGAATLITLERDPGGAPQARLRSTASRDEQVVPPEHVPGCLPPPHATTA